MKGSGKSGADLSRILIWTIQTLLSNQINVLQFCLIICETLVDKNVLLVNTRTF